MNSSLNVVWEFPIPANCCSRCCGFGGGRSQERTKPVDGGCRAAVARATATYSIWGIMPLRIALGRLLGKGERGRREGVKSGKRKAESGKRSGGHGGRRAAGSSASGARAFPSATWE